MTVKFHWMADSGKFRANVRIFARDQAKFKQPDKLSMKGDPGMVCEDYRENIMALMDEELDSSNRSALLQHLGECSGCAHEYRSYQKLYQISESLQHNKHCPDCLESHLYYRGVCRRLESRRSRILWVALAALLALAGFGLLYDAGNHLLSQLCATIAFGCAASVLVLSAFCGSCAARRHKHGVV